MKHHALTILTSFLLLAGSASSAFAIGQNECQVDTDCPDSYVCAETVSACADTPCEPGKECPAIGCNPGVYRSCEPAPPATCTSDSDCAAGLVCFTTTYTTCNGGAAPDVFCSDDGSDCTVTPAPTEETDCQQTQESYCVPPYVAPCTTDESCGSTGFTCEAVPVSCGCSAPGGGFDGNSDSSGSEDLPESAATGRDNSDDFDDCGCPEPDENIRACRLQELPCASNEDCSAGFICHFKSTAPDGSCSYDPATGTETCETIETNPNAPNEGRCAPADYPYWMSGPGSGGPRGDSNYDESTNDSGNHNGQPGAPGNSSNQPEQDSDAAAGQNDDGGCHIVSLNTTNTSTSTTALLLAGALGLFTLRRRKR